MNTTPVKIYVIARTAAHALGKCLRQDSYDSIHDAEADFKQYGKAWENIFCLTLPIEQITHRQRL